MNFNHSSFFLNDNLQITISHIEFNHPPYEIVCLVVKQLVFYVTVAVLFLMYILSYHKRAYGNLEGWNVLLSINDHYDIIPVVALCSLKTSAFEVVR